MVDYLDSRPVEAELEAIGVALDLARAMGCALHVVHVSSAAGLGMIADAKARGQDVTAETCPHYLLLADADVSRLGAVAKCAPPLRPAAEVERLWTALGEGKVDTVGSDHSPAPPELKTDADFFRVWGGISGCQHALPLFFEAAVVERGLSSSLAARLTAGNVARRFGLAGKGRLAVGFDADLVLLAVDETARPIPRETLRYRHPQSAYVGRPARVRVVETYARGCPLRAPIPKAAPLPAGCCGFPPDHHSFRTAAGCAMVGVRNSRPRPGAATWKMSLGARPPTLHFRERRRRSTAAMSHAEHQLARCPVRLVVGEVTAAPTVRSAPAKRARFPARMR